MRKMMLTNKGDVRNILGSNEASVKNKLARNSQWHVISISESFKQHGHMYLAILNLAAHLSSHPIARTLMNIGKKQVNTRKTVKSRSNQHKATTTKRDEPERVASVEQMQQPIHNYKERWKMLAAAAMGDGGFKTRSQCVADASFSSEYGRVTDSVSVEIQQKLDCLVFPSPFCRTHMESQNQNLPKNLGDVILDYLPLIGSSNHLPVQ